MAEDYFSPGPSPRCLRSPQGTVVEVPPHWQLLPPGDAALTRRVKAAGPFWAVAEKRGRKLFSQGIWADAATIERERERLLQERSQPSFARQREAAQQRRLRQQEHYVDDFTQAVLDFLQFHPRFEEQAQRLSQAVSDHATPVGSGTVARTQRIPLEQRAEAAVVAWMRHQTTAYDHLTIPRVKGQRREVRRQLASQSRKLLDSYRKGLPSASDCPLALALEALQRA